MNPTLRTREAEIWERYDAGPRIMTSEFIDTIPWERLGPSPGPDFLRALAIASDVETATYDVFFLQELKSSASGRDPILAAFMKRWVQEELTHGELLRKLLGLWGYQHSYATPRFGLRSRIALKVTQFFGSYLGEQFKFLHMIWGGINELTARETYRRLRNSTDDPVVRLLLGAMIKEESLHANFYLSMAEARHPGPVTRLLCRMAFRSWRPVGFWNKSSQEYRPVLGLFDAGYLNHFHRNVTREFERRFPVFSGSRLTERLHKLIVASRPPNGRPLALALESSSTNARNAT
jgi:hypothetical protein